MSNVTLTPYTSTTGKAATLYATRVSQNVSTEDVRKATTNNMLDEILVQGDDGNRYLVYADEIKYSNNKLPTAEQSISIPGLDIEGEVIFANDDKDANWRRQLRGALNATGLPGVMGAAAAAISSQGLMTVGAAAMATGGKVAAGSAAAGAATGGTALLVGGVALGVGATVLAVRNGRNEIKRFRENPETFNDAAIRRMTDGIKSVSEPTAATLQ